ncbi:MAG: carbamoyltransferase, partial [Deltaproteobacteria bacterium]|nr:carbamoyltransferase [Deltaproteobacteria bacterium]
MHGYHMGINLGHDRSVAVVRDGEILVAIEQERLDRIKHSVGFMVQSPSEMKHIQVPGECIRYCLDALGVPLSAMATITANMPGRDFGPEIMRGKFSRDISEVVCTIPSHHLAHAYSAWWPSGMDDALVFVSDGSGSTECTSDGRWKTESYTLYTARNGRLEPFHHERVQAHLASLSTLGFLYEHISRKAGFETRIGTNIRFAEAGKLMGLAAFGGPQPQWHRWLQPVPGEPRVSMSAYDIFLEVAALERIYNTADGRPYMRPWLVDLAHKVQKELEDALCHIISEAMAQTGLRTLCMAGGVALNSVANYKILQQCGLDDIFIFPAAADNGVAAGCALWAYAEVEGGTLRPPLRVATLGQPATTSQIDAAIEAHSDLLIVERKSPDDMVAVVADALSTGSIVARYEGGCEYGPRALGHRSILADPTFERMKDVINARVKFREAFRPFAPVIPLDRASEVFALGTKSPFMLLVADIRPEYHPVLPAITHADGTGRVQTCTAQDNPFFHTLCNTLADRRPGPPVLLNTSFNVAGQPIVETPTEAIATFLRTDIDYLALEDRWISKRHTPVKAYADHEATLVDEDFPEGLPPNAPSALALMAELDQALFHGGTTRQWSPEELTALSRQGGRYKETSRLFPEHGYLGPLVTEYGPHAVLLLDPLGESTLADPTQRQPPLSLSKQRLELLLATRRAPTRGMTVALRCRLGLGHRELSEQLRELRNDIARFGLTVDAHWDAAPTSVDSPIPTSVDRTLDPFSDPHYRLDTVLGAFETALRTHGYSEAGITKALGVESLQQIEPTHLDWHAHFQLPHTPLADLIRLFQLRVDCPRDRVEALLGAEVVAALLGLGVLTAADDTIRAGVDLFCSGGMFFATDHRYMLFEGDQLDEEPVMYIGMDSHGLVQTAPRAQSERVLDLCCGSGIQGL